jgi:hypothetical protein
MIAAGVNAKALSTYMGHANIKITLLASSASKVKREVRRTPAVALRAHVRPRVGIAKPADGIVWEVRPHPSAQVVPRRRATQVVGVDAVRLLPGSMDTAAACSLCRINLAEDGETKRDDQHGARQGETPPHPGEG